MTESLIGRRVRLTGEGWGTYGISAERGSVQTITHDEGYTPWAHAPGINPTGNEHEIWYVILDPERNYDEDVREWGGELLPVVEEEPPIGSIVTAPFDDIEGNVAERASDGFWLVTGEEGLSKWEELLNLAGGTVTVLRHGYAERTPTIDDI